MEKLFENNSRTKTADDMNSSMQDLMDPALNARFKIHNLPKQDKPLNESLNALPKIEIQSNSNPEKKANSGTSSAPQENLPDVYRPPLFDDPPANTPPTKRESDSKPDSKSDSNPDSKPDSKSDSKPDSKPNSKPDSKSDSKPEPKQDSKPASEQKSPTSFEPPKRREAIPTDGATLPTLPTLPPFVVPVDPVPNNKPTNKPAAQKDWFPTPDIQLTPESKVWPKTLTPIVPRDYSGDRRSAPDAPRDTAGAAYWKGKSISDPELISKGILEQSYVREVMSRHPDAVLIGTNGNIRYMNASGEFTLKTNVPLWLPRAAGLAFLRAQEEATRNGVPIQPENDAGSYNPAGRTNSQQQSAVRTARIAARVGASRHQSTGAMDIKNWNNPIVQRALRNAGWQHGDGRGPIANDYHHWSYAGG